MPFQKGYIPWNKGKLMPAESVREGVLARTGKKIPSLIGNKNALGHVGVFGEKNVMWRGDKAGYHALHKWICVTSGTPRKCENCGDESKIKYEWANKDHKYRRVKEDWMRLCVSCHRKYDMKNNNYRVAYLNVRKLIKK